MTHIFYFLTILPLIWELSTLVNIKKYHSFAMNVKKLDGKPLEEFSGNQIAYVIFQIGYLFWVCAGFFSSQWLLFILIFVFSLISKKWILVRWIDSLFTFILLIFIILNSYHLKIDLFQFLLNRFS